MRIANILENILVSFFLLLIAVALFVVGVGSAVSFGITGSEIAWIVPTFIFLILYFDKKQIHCIRRKWLISLFAFYAIHYLGIFLNVMLANKINYFFGHFKNVFDYNLFEFLFSIPLGTWVIYHCAYKKHGTKFLGFSLCVGLLAFSILFFNCFYCFFTLKFNSTTEIILFLLVHTIHCMAFAGYLFYSMKLYAINKAKKRAIEDPIN